MSVDFTLDKYSELCQAIMESGYEIITVRQYLEAKSSDSHFVVLRHDVDRRPGSALRMAQMEKRLGLASTYYFRHTKNVFRPNIIQEIATMGHEIGYHYEVLSEARGDLDKAIRIFETELSRFREICEIKTISMHGRPLSRWDNRNLWDKYDFTDFGLIGEVYLSIDYDKVKYFCDTGRTWNSQKYNLRDHVRQDRSIEIDTTDDLTALLYSKTVPYLCISCHPNRWTDSKMEWFGSYLSDWMANWIKLGFSLLSNLRGKLCILGY